MGFGKTSFYSLWGSVYLEKDVYTCKFVYDWEYFINATAVLTTLTGAHDVTHKKEFCQKTFYGFDNIMKLPIPPYQKWIGQHYEQHFQFRSLNQPKLLKLFDYEASWRKIAFFKVTMTCPTSANRTYLSPPPKKNVRKFNSVYSFKVSSKRTRCIC